ncbi:tRNA(m(1)G37)methyltransferase [Penicillium frequentans]|nr:tRNA(m(1)G37)methyltransferase [Penicillium glabrum]
MESSNDERQQVSNNLPDMFRPPVNRAMRTLDRSFFRKTVPIAAAKVFKNSEISKVRQELHKVRDLLAVPRLSCVRDLQEEDGVKKALLLRGDLRPDDKTTWSPTINALVEKGTVDVMPYDLVLDYDYWSYAEIIGAILPEKEMQEVPQGFTQVGHVAHLNLREQFFPYKFLIAEILRDKNPSIRTVINKIEDVGSQSQFRTFPFEVLIGENDLNVVQHEQDCEFRFDYARVYWNSRLETEHRRLVDKFKPGQMVCDVMAGVGPFAVPAGKRKIFVWGNDLNPHGYEVMQDAIVRNKVSDFVTPFNSDGREFIKTSAKSLLEAEPVTVTIKPKVKSRSDKKRKIEEGKEVVEPPAEVYTRPSIVDHYVMNLPATAIEFVDAFQGVYAGHEELFAPNTAQLLPMVHVYCFSGHSDNEVDDHIDICQRLSERIGYTITHEDRVGGTGNEAIELAIHNVRLVSPNKQMFCASFRLPAEVAFRKV